jgi:aerobic C4-dicarboxylate transport protein
MKRVLTNLTFWVLVAITIGVLIGHFAPGIAQYPVLQKPFRTNILGQEVKFGTTLSEFLGDAFIDVVKQFINPIIFLTITLGMVSMGNLKKVGRVGGKALLYFEIVTTFALVVGIAVAMVIRPGEGLDPNSIKGGDISKYIQGSQSFSWIQFLLHNSTLLVLIIAIITGIVLNYSSAREPIVHVFKTLSRYVFIGLHKVMLFAPIGALGGMAFTVSKFGLAALKPLALLMGSVYITMAVFIFGVLYLVLHMYRVNIFRYLKYVREEILIVLGTSSSEPALPSLMEKLERMGCSKSVVGLVIPAGYSFNLDGTTIYLSMCMIFLAQVFHVHLSLAQVFSIIGILMLTSKGAAGVTGSGFIVLASTLTTIKVIPIEGLALLLGVDRFMSEARAITNFIGNGVAAIWLANNEKEFNREKMELAFSNVSATENIISDNLEASTVNREN